jgi:hypothetical protein
MGRRFTLIREDDTDIDFTIRHKEITDYFVISKGLALAG